MVSHGSAVSLVILENHEPVVVFYNNLLSGHDRTGTSNLVHRPLPAGSAICRQEIVPLT
jgi:hypothetical protein